MGQVVRLGEVMCGARLHITVLHAACMGLMAGGASDALCPLLPQAVVMTLMLHHNPNCVKTLFVRSGNRTLSDEVQEAEYWDSLVVSMLSRLVSPLPL